MPSSTAAFVLPDSRLSSSMRTMWAISLPGLNTSLREPSVSSTIVS